MSINRHQIRKIAFQTLFALSSNPEAQPADVYRQLLDEVSKDQPTPAYLEQLVTGVLSQQAKLDALIEQHLNKNWTLARLNKTDLLILRLAVYEIKFEQDLANKIAIDEALQLAKEFSDEKSRRFINGVLNNLI